MTVNTSAIDSRDGLSIEREQPSTTFLDMTTIFATVQKIITAPLLAFALMTPMPEEPRFKNLYSTNMKAHTEARPLGFDVKKGNLASTFIEIQVKKMAFD